MRLYELSIPRTQEDAEEILYQSGWTVAGEGAYAQVYQKENKSYVLKIFHYSDTAYRDFVKLAVSNPNPHFPKFRGKLIKINDHYYAVRMEKLEKIVDNSQLNLVSWIGTYLHYGKMKMYKPLLFKVEKQRYIDEFIHSEQKLEKTPLLKEACDLIINNLLGKHNEDLHSANVMIRGSTLVLTDPVS